MKKILIIAAHPDDEILGAGGAILKHIKRRDNVSFLILGDGETSRDKGADIEKRRRQAERLAAVLGVKNLFIDILPDNKFDSLPLLEIVKKIERVINDVRPQVVYTHCPTDLNIDHRITFEAVLAACRPKPGFCVRKILAFEVLSSTEWQIKDAAHSFCPTEYIDISDVIEIKLNILQIYKDELLPYPNSRSLEGVRILAQYRGMEVGYKYAEAFQLIRNLND